jgi:lipid-binding SYLF domain-containing protein
LNLFHSEDYSLVEIIVLKNIYRKNYSTYIDEIQIGRPMRYITRSVIMIVIFTAIIMLLVWPSLSMAASKEEIDINTKKLLNKLLKETPIAQSLSERAVGILVFPHTNNPNGGQYDEGALIKNGKVEGYYNSNSAHHRFQGGRQKLGYFLFFMSNKALGYLDKSDGWEIGIGPSIEIVDDEIASAFGKSLTLSYLTKDIYSFFLYPKGLMPGPSLKGTKISRINPK